MDKTILSEIEAAEYLRRHVVTLRKWRRNGVQNITYLKIGGRYFYRQADLDAFLDSCVIRSRVA